jgi:hypothetical protein
VAVTAIVKGIHAALLVLPLVAVPSLSVPCGPTPPTRTAGRAGSLEIPRIRENSSRVVWLTQVNRFGAAYVFDE